MTELCQCGVLSLQSVGAGINRATLNYQAFSSSARLARVSLIACTGFF